MALQERRLLREKAIEDSIQQWYREIVPDWRVVHRNPALRKLWWRGIPVKLRAQMWERAVGNPLALSKGEYLPPRASDSVDLSLHPQTIIGHAFREQSGP